MTWLWKWKRLTLKHYIVAYTWKFYFTNYSEVGENYVYNNSDAKNIKKPFGLNWQVTFKKII